MAWKLFANMKPGKESYEFFLTFLCIIGFFILASWKNIDVGTTIPTVLGLYLAARATSKTTAMISASKDSKADLRQIVKDVEGLHKE